MHANAADRVFELTDTAPRDSEIGMEIGTISLSRTTGTDFSEGAEFEVLLPGGRSVVGTMLGESGEAPIPGKNEDFISASTTAKVISFANGAGSLSLHLVGVSIAGLTLLDTTEGRFYRSFIDGTGNGALFEVDADSILCSGMPKAPDLEPSQTVLDTIPTGLTLAIVSNLESRPGASNTIYINNYGGVLTGTAWNADYNSGDPIAYTPYSFDNDTTVFSDQDIDYMWLAWAEMAEDYADFDVNVTTSTSVYDTTPVSDRSQIISTTTCAWFMDCAYGGVAFLSIFGNTTDYLKTGWTWNSTPGSVGMTHSHEAGHQMGLGHDGTASLGYYSGHGVWGPIMGAPFNQEYVQWSIGEYPGANNSENDITTLISVLGGRPDDAGDTNGSAAELEATTGANFMLSHNNYLPNDIDVFEFSLSSPQQVSINLLPLLADGLESRAANAAINVELQDSAGVSVALMTSSDNSPLAPDTNTFSFSATLPAETYYLAVDAVSPDPNWTTGFGEYGNAGEYRMLVEIDPEITAPVPGSVLSGSTETFSWNGHGNDVDDYWVEIGASEGGKEYMFGSSLGGSASSVTANSLPTDGSTVYVRFWWRNAGDVWVYTDYTYTAADIVTSDPSVTTPVPATTLSGASEVFNWVSNGTAAVEYWLYAGSSLGGNQYFDSQSLGTALTVNATGLPTDGSTVHVRLWWKETSQAWEFVDYSYTAANLAVPTFTSPGPGSMLAGASDTFTWAANSTTVTEWWLYLGSAVGGQQYFDSTSLGMATSVTTPLTLPTDGSTVYGRLWYRSGAGPWLFIDDTFIAATTGDGPTITSPEPGNDVNGTPVTFSWDAGTNSVSDWWLYVGTSAGGNDIYGSGSLPATVLTDDATMPADGTTVHVTLWYQIAGTWYSTGYLYNSLP